MDDDPNRVIAGHYNGAIPPASNSAYSAAGLLHLLPLLLNVPSACRPAAQHRDDQTADDTDEKGSELHLRGDRYPRPGLGDVGN
ncbi:MAG TPA: hypothetical protein VKX96_06700 [Chloroflexota bacterium]|nr:hypothetical protein [Chloroflexota bacterium]